MFRKENSSCATAKNNNNAEGNNSKPPPPSTNKGKNKKGKNKNQQQRQQEDSSSSSKALDTPLRKSDIRNLKQKVRDFFLLSSLSQEGTGGATSSSEEEEEDQTAQQQQQQQQQQQLEEKITSILDQVFVANTIATRQLHHAELGKLTLYVRAPNNNSSTGNNNKGKNNKNNNDNSNNNEKNFFVWPYLNHQILWICQPPMPNTNQLEVSIPTLALLSVLPCSSFGDDIIIPTVYIPSNASKFLCRGAHLMRAGMLNLPSSLVQESAADTGRQALLQQQNNKPRIVAISVVGNPQPMAVGLIDHGVKTKNNIGPNTKGIGATIWTCYGDDLWKQQMLELETININASAADFVAISPYGGAPYNDGNYGNVGFLQGEGVLPIVQEKGQDDNDDNDNDNDNGEAKTKAESAWDSNEPTSTSTPKEGEEETSGPAATEGETTTTKETTDEAVTTTSPGNEDDDAATGNNNHSEVEETTADGGDGGGGILSQEELLHQTVCKTLLTSLSPKDLPMTVANFYANHVLPNRPDGTTIQLKQTKYKKFGNYLAEQVQNKLVTLGPGPNNNKNNNKDKTGYLISFDKRHPDLLNYKQEHSDEVQQAKEATQAAQASKQLKLVLVNLYVVPHHFVKNLRLDPDAVKAVNASSKERAGTGMLTMPEVRALLESYLTREELIEVDQVKIDGPLFDALYKKKQKKGAGGGGAGGGQVVTNDTLLVSRKDINDEWVGSMSPAYAIVQMPGNKVQKLGKGQPPKVQIEVSMRQSRKFITKIRGMEAYGVNGQILAKDVGQRLACQAAVETFSEKGPALAKGCVEIVLGGNFADELEALLLGDEKLCPGHGGIKNSNYKLPKGSVDVVLRKGVPARKKRGGGGGGKKK